jgi:hypothetical protein
MIRVNGRARAPQYWKMDRQIYARGEPPFYTKLTPEFCFGHWSTQCRSAFQVPRAAAQTLTLHLFPAAHPRCCRLQPCALADTRTASRGPGAWEARQPRLLDALDAANT